MTNTFRSLCTELFNELQGYKVAHPHHDRSLLIRARTTLAQPAPPAEGEAVELLQAAHASFKLTQDPADYSADHWSRRATELLDRTHRAALAQPEPAGEVTDEELDKVMFQAVWARMDDASDWTSDELDLL